MVHSFWQPPCLTIELGPSQNRAPQFWNAPAPGGPGPFRNRDYTVRSWLPSPGVLTWWENREGNLSQVLGWPGVARLEIGWEKEIWRWWAVWEDVEDRLDPSPL